MKYLILVWCVLCLLPVDLKAQQATNAPRPNILLILADDLGYGDLGCYNPESTIPTPNLDQLAQQGMRFLDAHSPCTVCTPTRYGLMTGQMPFRIPRGGKVFTGAGGPSLIADERLTLPELLQQQGYATACVGKWHLGLTFYDAQGNAIHRDGLDAVREIDFSKPVDGGPLDCGFEYFFGTACCPTTDWLYAFIEGKHIPVPPEGQLDRSELPQHPYANDCRPGMIAPDFDMQEVDLQFLEKSQAFLRKHVRQHPKQPFFLFHSTQAVHLPSFPAKSFQGKSGSGPHGDFIHELDHVVGELLKTLKELEVEDNTLVIFTSDNGPEVASVHYMRNDHDHDGARPWRGIKRDNWEGGHRVPFLVRWPQQVSAATSCDQLVCLTDVMATVADLVEFDLPNDAGEDSFSMLPLLKSQPSEQQPVRPFVLHQGFAGKRTLAIRQGPWKYLAHQGSGGNRYDHRLLKEFQLADNDPDAPAQLYHLERDPGETTNLYSEYPEQVQQMKSLLESTIDSGRSAPRR